jgi:hypothetical protein
MPPGPTPMMCGGGGGGTMQPGVNARPGDWACTGCGNSNFAFRSKCNVRGCNGDKPADHGMKGGGMGGGYGERASLAPQLHSPTNRAVGKLFVVPGLCHCRFRGAYIGSQSPDFLQPKPDSLPAKAVLLPSRASSTTAYRLRWFGCIDVRDRFSG